MKKETLEEVAKRLYTNHNYQTTRLAKASITQEFKELILKVVKEGAKYQQERSYSEEEVLEMLDNFNKHTLKLQELKLGNSFNVSDWFENFKKK